MQYLFQVILLGALGVGVVVLSLMALAQRFRDRGLIRAAQRLGLRYARRDPFELTRRYRGFVLASAGHSPRAENVLHGQYERFHVRAFDYRYEAGHGPGRRARRYGVIVADVGVDLAPAVLWHERDAEQAPLAACTGAGKAGPWRIARGGAFAKRLADVLASLGAEPVNVETLGQSVMIYTPRRIRTRRIGPAVQAVAACLSDVRALACRT